MKETVARDAALAALYLRPEEEALAERSMLALKELSAAMDNIPSAESAPARPITPRADEPRPSLPREQLLKNAPAVSDNLVLTPRAFEEEKE